MLKFHTVFVIFDIDNIDVVLNTLVKYVLEVSLDICVVSTRN